MTTTIAERSPAAPVDPATRSDYPRARVLGTRLTGIMQALRRKQRQERENRAEQLAKLRELQRFD